MDTLGLLLKIIGSVCLFLGMCMAGHVSTYIVGFGLDSKRSMSWYGIIYILIALALIISEIVNMVVCYALGKLKDKKLDMVWQIVVGVLALCIGFMFCVPMIYSMSCHPLGLGFTYCAGTAEKVLYVLSTLLALGAGALFIFAGVVTKPGK